MNREMLQFVAEVAEVAEVAGCVVALGFVSLIASLV